MARLAGAAADAAPYLKQRVRPVGGKAVDGAGIAKLVADLDADDFDIREKAEQELSEIGDAAGPALRKALVGDPSAELKQRAGELLDKLGKPDVSPEVLRLRRAVEALERAGTAEAQLARGIGQGKAPGRRDRGRPRRPEAAGEASGRVRERMTDLSEPRP